MTRILVVAASPVVRAGLDAVLASNPALEVVGQASAMGTLAPQVAAMQPDVVVVELEGHEDPAATSTLVTCADCLSERGWAAPLSTTRGPGRKSGRGP